MSNMIKLKYNFLDDLELLKEELQPYFDLVDHYEKNYADWSLPRRTMAIYPGGTTQKSWYANRKVNQKKIRVNHYEDYDAMSMYLLVHNLNTTTLSAKHVKNTSSIVEKIKLAITEEKGISLARKGANDVKVEATKETVFVRMTLPLEADISGDKVEINDYQTEINIPLKNMYEVGSIIADHEREYSILGK